jgi:GcrA cell cycle regulator
MSGWTDDKVETLKRMHLNDHSFSEIANAIGMTRNACIGKAHRLGMSKPVAPVFRKNMEATARAKRVVKALAQHADDAKARRLEVRAQRLLKIDEAFGPLPESRPVALTEAREFHCRWPIDGDEFHFCGAIREKHSSYCSNHVRLSLGVSYKRVEQAA